MKKMLGIGFVWWCLIMPAQLLCMSSDSMGLTVALPQFEARIGVGFNYDLLRAPTDVSFDHATGYFGFNLPLEQKFNIRDFSPVVNSIFADSSVFTNGDQFKPTGTADQNTNMTVRVDVPMMGGVATFSDIQNFMLNYETVLGNSSLVFSPDSLGPGMSFFLRGAVNVPLNLSLGWETMTFGYAYRVNPDLIFALNLHRHLFTFDLKAKVDVDLLGRYRIDLGSQGGDAGLSGSAVADGLLDYPSDKINGEAYGHYEAEAWTPSIGLKLWRFTLTSRFGVDTRAHGTLTARYALPFFIDPQSFQPSINFQNPQVFNDPAVRAQLMSNAVDSVAYTTSNDMIWKLPQAHTIEFEIIRDHLSISYTKLFGEVSMYLNDISQVQQPVGSTTSPAATKDSVVIDLGVTIDNIMLVNVKVANSFLNVGMFGMDIRYGDQSHILSKAMGKSMQFDGLGIMPVLNFGTALGTKWQLMIEADVLPLPAIKSGICYNF